MMNETDITRRDMLYGSAPVLADATPHTSDAITEDEMSHVPFDMSTNNRFVEMLINKYASDSENDEKDFDEIHVSYCQFTFV
jgi:hypothetical protein